MAGKPKKSDISVGVQICDKCGSVTIRGVSKKTRLLHMYRSKKEKLKDKDKK